MKRKHLALFLSLMILAAALPPAAQAQSNDYTGHWVCVGVDLGDGVPTDVYMGTAVADLMQLRLEAGGEMTVISMGQEMPGTWAETAEGISALIEGQQVLFSFQNGQLVNNEQGVTIYLEKQAAAPKAGGLLSLMIGKSYVGKWVSTAVDQGDGQLVTDIGGMSIVGFITLQINADGSVLVNSMGAQEEGQWAEAEGGIRLSLADETLDLQMKDGRLTQTDEGVTLYFTRDTAQAETPPPSPAGQWEAVHYETAGYTLDIKTFFSDGLILTLNADGTGSAPLSPEFTETFHWAYDGGALSFSGAFVLSSPVWDIDKQELRINYGTDAVVVVFHKLLIQSLPDEPAAEPTQIPATPEPVATLSPATPEPTAEVTEAGSAGYAETTLFTASFEGEGWEENTGSRNDRKDYSTVTFALKDDSDSTLGSVTLTAGIDAVRGYRDKIKTLTERAEAQGKDSLDKTIIGGKDFLGTSYERWGWQYTEYTARSVDESATLSILIERPEMIGEDKLQAVLNSITYRLPEMSPPNVDPPLPEDGEPYAPQTADVTLGDLTLSARWIPLDKSLILDSIFDNSIALSDGRIYALTGKVLNAFTYQDGQFVADPVLENGVMKLSDKFDVLAAGKGDILYVSHGVFNTLALQNGSVTDDYPISGRLAMHPSGEWGLTHFANAEPARISVEPDGTLVKEPWVLSGLNDAAARKGRFSMISYIHITEDRIYVAGTDSLSDDAHRVAVFNLNGEELFTFGGKAFSDEDTLGSVTGILESKDNILVMDGNYRAFKLFSLQGDYLGKISCDPFLGTDYPWLASMAALEDGALVSASQARKDGSGNELLFFVITGY